MSGYIDIDDACKEIGRFRGYLDDDMIMRLQIALERCQEVDAEPIVHSAWTRTGQSFINPNKFLCFCCARCHHELDEHIRIEPKYCPNCGAKMDVESIGNTND